MIRVLPLLVVLWGCSDEGASPAGAIPDLREESGLVFGTPQVYEVELRDNWTTSVAPSGPVVVARFQDGRSRVTPLYPHGEPYDGPLMGPGEDNSLRSFLGGGDPSLLALGVDEGNSLMWELSDDAVAPRENVLPDRWELQGARADDTLFVVESGDLVAVDLPTGGTRPVPLVEERWVLWASTGHGLLLVQTDNYLQVLDTEGALRWVTDAVKGVLMVTLDERTVLLRDVETEDLVLLDLEPGGFVSERVRFPWPRMNDRYMAMFPSTGGASLVSVQWEEGRAVVIPVTWEP